MRAASIFAGIGGFELGFHQAGINTVYTCEIDAAARSVLRNNFGNGKIDSDIRRVADLPQTDIVVAGFPCQDLSSVGKKDGISGRNSSLIDEVFRLVEKGRPEWVILENVYFMLHLKKGAGIKKIVETFRRLGYRWAYRTVDSQSFSLPQRRRRVFVVASLNGDPRAVLLSDRVSLPKNDVNKAKALGFYWTEGTRALGLAPDAIPPLKGGSGLGIPSAPAILRSDRTAITPDIRDAERLQGFPEDWTKCVEVDHKPGVRWRLIGNAVTVPVARWIGENLERTGHYVGAADYLFSPGSGTWPNCAWGGFDDGIYVPHGVTDWPLAPTQRGVEEFLKWPGKPLSQRATMGFLQRASKSKLRFPDGFISALEEHVDNITTS